jgi:protein-S-isoprenylcysteine O-methyltransferase Ste14
MAAQSENHATGNSPSLVPGIVRRGATVVIFVVMIAAILFLASGRLDWTWAWVYLGISLVVLVVNATIMLRTNPETAAERGRGRETKNWDKVVSGLWGLAIYIALPLVASLDARFGWTRDPGLAWHLAGAILLAASFALSAWAMLANAFFSTAVAIQSDRGHTVCNTGPYRFVRHPGYVGFIVQSLAMSLLFGSWWSLVPAIAAAALMILRTALEDRMLQAELPGYRDYALEVRYRLIPGGW